MKDEQAFPCDSRSDWMNPGMTLRDYFAAKAMGAMVSGEYEKFAHMAIDAYAIADAMLAARKGAK